MARQFGEVMYTLTNLLVASFNITAGTYGTPMSVADGQMLVSEPESDTDKQRGYGKIVRGLTVPVGSKITFEAGGMDFLALQIVVGATLSSSGSTPNRVRTVKFGAGGAGLPYFGVIGVAPTDDGGIAVIGHRAVKLDNVPTVTMDGKTNKFGVSEISGYSFPQDSYLETLKQYETAADWTAPASGAAFLAFFS